MMNREYVLSKDNRHRLKLKYTWDSSRPTVLFIMLNPSYMRPEGELSPTSKIIIDWAKANGYGSLYVGNLFSFITADPSKLLEVASFAVSDENDTCLRQMAVESRAVIFAWGNYKLAERRAKTIKVMFPKGKAIFYNRDGTPAHPLSGNFLWKVKNKING